MIGRPVNERRRAALLDAVVDYTIEHGLTELTWRPVAAALGVTPTTLVHRFGSKERMLEAVQGRLRERILTETSVTNSGHTDLASSARTVWERTSSPAREAEFRLFFAIYGQALQNPGLYADFLDHVVADWMGVLRDAQDDLVPREDADRAATLVMATLRGLLLDLLATSDRDRVNNAAECFITSLH